MAETTNQLAERIIKEKMNGSHKGVFITYGAFFITETSIGLSQRFEVKVPLLLE